MITRIRPYYNTSYIDSANSFDPEVPRSKYTTNISKVLEKYYSNSKGFEFLDYGRKSLSVAIDVLNIKREDEILVPCFTCSSVLETIIHKQIKPVLYEINYDFTININQINNKITRKTKAIIVTHYFGIPSNVKEIKEISDENGIYIIEDCAHALCSEVDNIQLGSTGDIAFTSFGIDKPLSLGKGSILIINNSEAFNKLEYKRPYMQLNSLDDEKCAFISMILFYLETEKSRYNKHIGVDYYYNQFKHNQKDAREVYIKILNKDMDLQGLIKKYDPSKFNGIQTFKHLFKKYIHNSKNEIINPPNLMNSFSLNLLCNAMTYISMINRIRTENGKMYEENLKNNNNLFAPTHLKDVPFLRYPIICKNPLLTNKLNKELLFKGYEVGNFNWGSTLNNYLNIKEKYETSEYISKNIINLPCYTDINENEILDMCKVINSIRPPQPN